jgi:hypothetical protein
MAEKKGGGSHGSAMNDLKWFIAILVALWLLWFFTGGPTRSKQEKPFVEPISATSQKN